MSKPTKRTKQDSSNGTPTPVRPEWIVLRELNSSVLLKGATFEVKMTFERDEWLDRGRTQRQIALACRKLRDRVQQLVEQSVDQRKRSRLRSLL